MAEWNSWSLLVKVRVTASCLLFLLVTWHWRLEELKVSRLVFPFLKTNTIQVYKSFALCVLLPSWGEKKLRWNKIFLYLFWCGQFLESLLNLLCSTTSVVDGLFFVFVCLSKKDLSSLTMDQTSIPCIESLSRNFERQSLNHWIREVPDITFECENLGDSNERIGVFWTTSYDDLILIFSFSSNKQLLFWGEEFN